VALFSHLEEGYKRSMTNSTPQHEHIQLNTSHIVSSLSDEFLSLLVDELNTENVTALALVGSYALSTLLTPCPICTQVGYWHRIAEVCDKDSASNVHRCVSL
jgi:hypothetical protein